jgi:hypothetical protein
LTLKKKIDSLSAETIQKQNDAEELRVKKEHEDFLSNLKKGYCFQCGNRMDSFKVSQPCFHWFTYPSGIKKKHFENYLKYPISFFGLRTYLYWLADSERLFANINNLQGEISSTSYFEATIRYKNLQYSFSVGDTDLAGHPNSQSDFPHYHIQVKRDGFVVLKFGDFHIPFAPIDLFIIKMKEKLGDRVFVDEGVGINILENEENLPFVMDQLIVDDNEDEAAISLSSIITVGEGEVSFGESLVAAINESERTGSPIAKILASKLKKSTVKTIISPGKGVPEFVKRSGKK